MPESTGDEHLNDSKLKAIFQMDRVGIAFYETIKVRTLVIARSEIHPKADEPKVWFVSPESFAKLLSNRNRTLLPQPR